MILVNCPHCEQMIEIVELNCRIFRCGIKKINGEQINPHLSKDECDKLVEENQLFGCGKPFLIEIETNDTNEPVYKASICGYI